MKSFFLPLLFLTFTGSIDSAAQNCGTRKLDPQVAGFLKMIGYQDMTLNQLRTLPIEKLNYPQIPVQKRTYKG